MVGSWSGSTTCNRKVSIGWLQFCFEKSFLYYAPYKIRSGYVLHIHCTLTKSRRKILTTLKITMMQTFYIFSYAFQELSLHKCKVWIGYTHIAQPSLHQRRKRLIVYSLRSQGGTYLVRLQIKNYFFNSTSASG